MQFVANKEESEKDEEENAVDMLNKSKGIAKALAMLNLRQRGYNLGGLRESLSGIDANADESKVAVPGGPGGSSGGGSVAGGKYVPPSMRGGGDGSRPTDRLGESMPDRRRSKSKTRI